MGTQPVLPAIGLALAIAAPATAGGWRASHAAHERVAVIDLGPGDAESRKQLAEAVVAAGLDPVIGDGVEDALAGISPDRDAPLLAAALDDARRAFDESRCKDATTAAQTAIAIAAARQAAGLPVPELGRAWSYVLSCADRERDPELASIAAARLRVLGAAHDLLARYPEIDALSNADQLEIEIKPEIAGAAIWVDFQPVTGTHVVLAAGRHVIAAAAGTRRGVVSGTVVKSQPIVAIPMPDQVGAFGEVAARVASWHGQMPAPAEIGWVLAHVHARAALIRRGDAIEAWGRAGLAEAPHRLGDDDGTGTLADAARLCAMIEDRAKGWDDHAPDPDKPLLRETSAERKGPAEEPTKWWVYAAIAGAVLAGAAVIYAHDSASDTQRVTLHYP